MTIINNMDFKCPRCGAFQKLSYYESVTATKNPELKQQILNKTIFIKYCSSCGAGVNLMHPILYSDPSKDLFVWFYKDSRDSIEEDIHDAMDIHGFTLGKKCINRMVYSLDELIEKIRIFDANLNDFFIHMIKFIYHKQLGTTSDRMQFIGVVKEGNSLGFRFELLDSNQGVTISGINNPLETSRKWDDLASEFDWVYIDDRNYLTAWQSVKHAFI